MCSAPSLVRREAHGAEELHAVRLADRIDGHMVFVLDVLGDGRAVRLTGSGRAWAFLAADEKRVQVSESHVIREQLNLLLSYPNPG